MASRGEPRDPVGMTGPVLLAFDGTPGSEHAIEVAARLFGGGPAVVVHLHEPAITAMVPMGAPGAALPPPDLDPQEDLRRATLIAEEGCRIAERAGFIPHERHAIDHGSANIAEAILGVAEREDARVIVVGQDRRSRLAALLLGSVSEHVMRRGHRPVLVVPQEEE